MSFITPLYWGNEGAEGLEIWKTLRGKDDITIIMKQGNIRELCPPGQISGNKAMTNCGSMEICLRQNVESPLCARPGKGKLVFQGDTEKGISKVQKKIICSQASLFFSKREAILGMVAYTGNVTLFNSRSPQSFTRNHLNSRWARLLSKLCVGLMIPTFFKKNFLLS